MRRPGKGRVLDEDPPPAPGPRLQAQGVEGIVPAVIVSGNTTNFQLKIMGLQSGAKIAAILLDGVRGYVPASEKSNDGGSHFGKARTWFSSRFRTV